MAKDTKQQNPKSIREREGLIYSRSYIALLMKQLGLKSVVRKQFKVFTTDSNHVLPVAENILNRDFTSNKVGEKWASDISYIKVRAISFKNGYN